MADEDCGDLEERDRLHFCLEGWQECISPEPGIIAESQHPEAVPGRIPPLLHLLWLPASARVLGCCAQVPWLCGVKVWKVRLGLLLHMLPFSEQPESSGPHVMSLFLRGLGPWGVRPSLSFWKGLLPTRPLCGWLGSALGALLGLEQQGWRPPEGPLRDPGRGRSLEKPCSSPPTAIPRAEARLQLSTRSQRGLSRVLLKWGVKM